MTDFYPTRMFGSMREEERGPEVAATFPFRQWSGLDSKLKAGFAYRNKDRDSQLAPVRLQTAQPR